MLPEAVRDGTPYAMHEERRDPDALARRTCAGCSRYRAPEHEANAALVPVEEPRRLLDVAGGHGGFSMAMYRRQPVASRDGAGSPAARAQAGREIVEPRRAVADRVAHPRRSDVFDARPEGRRGRQSPSSTSFHHLPEERDRELVGMAGRLCVPAALVIGDTERRPGRPRPRRLLQLLLAGDGRLLPGRDRRLLRRRVRRRACIDEVRPREDVSGGRSGALGSRAMAHAEAVDSTTAMVGSASRSAAAPARRGHAEALGHAEDPPRTPRELFRRARPDLAHVRGCSCGGWRRWPARGLVGACVAARDGAVHRHRLGAFGGVQHTRTRAKLVGAGDLKLAMALASGPRGRR